MKEFDMIVIGGGMVGAATALGLAKQGKKVLILERNEPIPFAPEQPMDLRVSALSHASVNILKSLGVWDEIVGMRLCPYRRLETWEYLQCRLGFDADSLGLPELGFIVENRVVQLALWSACKGQENLTLLSAVNITGFDSILNGHKVLLESGETFFAPLLVGADGAHSRVRDHAHIGVTAWDYRHHCMLVNVETALPQQDVTWQYFTKAGPRAFLPLKGHQASLVWYDTPSRIKQLCALSKEALRVEILENFPKELGDIQVLQAGAFPLTRRHAHSYFNNRVVLIGDAAHTINPLAGQGVNLGFKDVCALLKTVEEAGMAWKEPRALEGYEKSRKYDNHLMQAGMDIFYAGFSNEILPLKIMRNIGLKLAQNSGEIKKQVLKYAMGL